MASSWIKTRTTKDGKRRYTAYYRDNDGEDRCAGTHATKAAAERAARAALRPVDLGGAAIDPNRELLRIALPRWNDARQLRSAESRRRSGFYVADIVRFMGTDRVCDIRPGRVRELMAALTKRGQAPRTVNGARSLLHKFYAEALADGTVAANPVAVVKPLPVGRPKLVVPSASDVGRLVAAAAGTFYEIPVMLSATTGARRGEILGLVWDNVDIDTGRLSIRFGLQRVEVGDGGRRELRRVPPKSERANRTVVLPPAALARLRAWRLAQAERMLSLGVGRPSGATPVCSDPAGGFLDPDAYSHAVGALAASVGLDGARLHDLRHAYASTLVASNLDIQTVADVLGHHSAAFTLQTYSHGREGAAERAAEAIGRALGGSGGSSG